MSDGDAGTGMELEDINLPLDEIISRKATREQAERPPRGRGFRRHAFSRGRYPPPPPPPRNNFNHENHIPIPDQSGPDGGGLPPPYFQDLNYMNQPYPWHPRNEVSMMNPNFNPNPVQPGWIPPQCDQGEMNFSQRPGGPPSRRGGSFHRGGVRKPIGRRRHGEGRRNHREIPPPPTDIKPQEEERCKLSFENGVATISFRGIEVIKVNSCGDIVLTTDGHQDGEYLKAINDVLSLINMEILGEVDKKETWKVKDSRTLLRYYDGVSIKGKGEPSKSRAETIRKAFEQPNPKALEATLASNLAARRLGLAFDPVGSSHVGGPGGAGMAPGGSIRITQDQQLTKTSNYSISFVDQEREVGPDGPYPPSYPLPDSVRRKMSQGRLLRPY